MYIFFAYSVNSNAKNMGKGISGHEELYKKP